MADSSYSIETKKLTKKYGKTRAVNRISFNIEKGQIVGFLGPNGAGKSTTMRILAGLIPATSGKAYLEGVSVARHPEKIREFLGYMPENNPLPEDLRVLEYLAYRAKLKGIPFRQQKKRIETVMDLCDLNKEAKNKIIRNLSKGYRQRVGIADCLLAKPKVAIMDEPTIGLDPHQVLSIRELVNNLRGEVTLLISSHILSEIEQSCDKVIIMNRGNIVAEGSHKSLCENFIPHYTYTLDTNLDKEKLKPLILQLDQEADINRKDLSDSFSRYTIQSKQNTDFTEKIIGEVSKFPDARIREIYKKSPSLEEVFIEATKKHWHMP